MILARIQRLKWKLLVSSTRSAAALTLVLTAFVILNFNSLEDYTVLIPSHIDESVYLPLQPEVEEDFPTEPERPARIPHLLHQTSRNTCVYEENIKYMKSFIELNKGWKYYFWTDDSARTLITEKHKDLLHIYDGVTRGVKRGDILRYVVMYELGGVYADTDIENIRPLNRVTKKYSCILPPEPVEQSALLRNMPYMINNAIMLCSPKHPFFKRLLDNIFITAYLRDVVAATGPKFVTNEFNAYNNFSDNISWISSEELRVKDFFPVGSGPYNADDEAAIYVPNTHYFTNDLDVKLRGSVFVSKCKDFFSLTELQRRACVELQTKGLIRKNETFTYTKHHWHHSWALNKYESYFKKCVEVETFIPNVHFYETN